MKLKGTITALITPFINNELDEEGLAQNIRFQIEQGIEGILPLGSTGESSTLSNEEQARIIAIALKEGSGKIPVWAGTGTYCTRQTIDKTKRARDLGVDVALIVTPYYNRPTQEGIFRHFEAITSSVDIPIVIYNIPGRCGTNIETATLARIAELPNIVGVKESSGNINQTGDFVHTISAKHPNFSVFSGDDVMTLPMMALGASGVVSVLSNLVPAKIIQLTHACVQRKFDLAKEIHYHLLPLCKAAFVETNPIPIKAAMKFCGMPSGECRLPLYQMAHDNLNNLHRLLIKMQLIR